MLNFELHSYSTGLELKVCGLGLRLGLESCGIGLGLGGLDYITENGCRIKG